MAVLTVIESRSQRVQDVPANNIDVRLHVVSAVQSLWSGENLELFLCASDWCLSERCRHQTRCKVGDWIDAIHEDPEAWEDIRSSEDTAESVHHDGETVGDSAGEFLAVNASNHHDTKGSSEEEDNPKIKGSQKSSCVNGVRPFSVPEESDGVVPNKETQDSHYLFTKSQIETFKSIGTPETTYRVPEEFSGDAGEKESGPAICLRLSFPALVQCSASDKGRNELDHHVDDDECYDKDTEHLILETLHCVCAIEEREANEKRL